MLDSDGETINIRNLTLPEASRPIRRHLFDPERDISTHRWQIIDDFIDQYKDVQQQPALFTYQMQEDIFMSILAGFKLMAPERVADFPLDSIKARVLKRLSLLSETYKNNNTIALQAALAAVQFYDRDEVLSALPATFREWLLRVAKDQSNPNVGSVTQLILGVHTLYPEEKAHIPVPAFQNDWIDQLDEIYDEDGIRTWVHILSNLKYTHPAEVAKILTPDKIDKALDHLRLMEDLPGIVEMSQSLAILSADRIVIGDKGRYQLIYESTAPVESTISMPVIKK